MKLTRYDSAMDFLKRARAPLEVEEAANSLIVGIASRVAEHPEQVRFPAYFATVESEASLVHRTAASADEGERVVAAAVRTPPFRAIVHSSLGGDPAPLRLILDDLLDVTAGFPPDSPLGHIPGVIARSAVSLAFAQLWKDRTGKPFTPGVSQRIYELRQVTPPTVVPGHLRPARDDEIDLLADWIYHFSVDARVPSDAVEARVVAERRIDSGDVFVWEDDGRPVSVAGKSRPSSHGITVNLVYTPPELRNRGYASACVATLSQQLLDAGWEFCTLYTDLANPTSNSIYQRIGYRPVCDSNEYDFEA